MLFGFLTEAGTARLASGLGLGVVAVVLVAVVETLGWAVSSTRDRGLGVDRVLIVRLSDRVAKEAPIVCTTDPVVKVTRLSHLGFCSLLSCLPKVAMVSFLVLAHVKT